MIPNKIYLAFKDGFVAQAANVPEVILDEYEPVEFVNRKALLGWVKEQWLNTRNGTMADQIRSSAFEEMMKHIKSL